MTDRKWTAGTWIIFFVVACVSAVGTFWLMRDRACDRWQKDYQVALEADERSTGGVFGFTNQGPTDQRLSELRDVKPGGCTVPERP